ESATGFCGQAVVTLVDTDPAAARRIVIKLDSVGVDILAYLRVVKLIAEAELDLSELTANRRKRQKTLIGRGRSSRSNGAAYRRVVQVKTFNDLADVYIGDFLLLSKSFKFDVPKDLPSLKW